MSRQVGEDVQKIIIDFIGINYCTCTHCGRGCRAFTKKGKECKTKPTGGFIFCTQHRKLIRKLANDNDIKDIAISYLLMVYKGPNRKKITSNGITTKKVQEVPIWVGGNSCSEDFFYNKRQLRAYNDELESRTKKRGYCICPWCIEQYFKFFNRYSDRIIKIRKMIHLNSYPYNSTIDLFNNNVVRINETIQKKNKDKSVGFWRHKMIPKKRLLNQFNSWNDCNDGTPTMFCCEKYPLKYIVSKSYTECANNTKFETQYMKGGGSKWSGNYHRLQNTSPLVALSSYEIAKIGLIREILLKKIVLTGNGLELLPGDIIRLICSFFYEKMSFYKSFLHKKRIQFWKLVDQRRNFWIKIDEEGNPIRPTLGLAGGGRL